MNYFITHKLGEGSYGQVFRCRDFFGQPFVLKILKPFKPKQEVERDWEKEVGFLLGLRHPNVIHIFDMFQFRGWYCMVLEEAAGSLRDLVATKGRLPQADVISVAGQILSALHHIHSRGVIHRDLQIDNILYINNKASSIDPYLIKITDFGISKFHAGMDWGIQAFTNIGRPYDVAPELVTMGYTTQQSDIYQLGLVLYYLYTGAPALGPEDGSSPDAIIGGVARLRAEAIGTPLGYCIAKMLRRHTEWRFKDSREVWLELSQLKNTASSSAPASGPAPAQDFVLLP